MAARIFEGRGTGEQQQSRGAPAADVSSVSSAEARGRVAVAGRDCLSSIRAGLVIKTGMRRQTLLPRAGNGCVLDAL